MSITASVEALWNWGLVIKRTYEASEIHERHKQSFDRQACRPLYSRSYSCFSGGRKMPGEKTLWVRPRTNNNLNSTTCLVQKFVFNKDYWFLVHTHPQLWPLVLSHLKIHIQIYWLSSYQDFFYCYLHDHEVACAVSARASFRKRTREETSLSLRAFPKSRHSHSLHRLSWIFDVC